jgi:hypothetical protein
MADSSRARDEFAHQRLDALPATAVLNENLEFCL